MKKLSIVQILSVILLVAFVAISGVALAGQVYGRDTVALGAATGTGSWTNGYQYAGVRLNRIWDEANLVAANTVTVSRILTGTTTTQLVASLFVASSIGNTNSGAQPLCFLKFGDQLLFSSTAVTGSTVVLDLEVQQH